MHRRTFVRGSSIALTGVVAGCLGAGGGDGDGNGDDSDGDDSDGDGDGSLPTVAGSLSVVDSPTAVTVRDTVEFDLELTNDGDDDHDVAVSVDVGDERREEVVTVVAGDGETATVGVDTDYESVERGGIALGENEWTVTANLEDGTESGTLAVRDAPVEWYQPDEEKICPVCNMLTEMYEGWHAQATHADGSRIEFCSLGCAVEYWIHPEDHDATDYDGKHDGTIEDELVTIWAPEFTDVDTDPDDGSSAAHPGWEAFIDMREGYFVLDSRTFQKYTTPMPGGSPVCFAEYDDALAYVDEWDELTEDDIVELEDLADVEAGKRYRANYQA